MTRSHKYQRIQHGDPLGPLLYSLATLPLAQELNSELKVMYLDDTTLGGTNFVRPVLGLIFGNVIDRYVAEPREK